MASVLSIATTVNHGVPATGCASKSLALPLMSYSIGERAFSKRDNFYSGIFNIGIGAGALLGNQVSIHLSMANIGYIGAVLALASLMWCIFIFRRYAEVLAKGY